MLDLSAAGPTCSEPSWVAEGEAIPVAQAVLAGTTLGPAKKLAVIETITGELAKYSAENAEVIISSLMRSAAGRQLDASIIADAAADDSRPAGILAGIPSLSATADGGTAALAGDVDQLLAALVLGGFGASPVLLMAPGRAARARILAQGLDVPIITAPGLTATTVVAVDANGFYSGFGPIRKFRCPIRRSCISRTRHRSKSACPGRPPCRSAVCGSKI